MEKRARIIVLAQFSQVWFVVVMGFFSDASVELRVTEQHTVVADHPFLFYIKYKGIIVFVGRRVKY